MLPLGQLLSRFKNLTNTDKVKKVQLSEIFKQNSLPIEVKQISFSKKDIFVKAPPIIKTELLLKKNEILEQIQAALGKDEFLDIR